HGPSRASALPRDRPLELHALHRSLARPETRADEKEARAARGARAPMTLKFFNTLGREVQDFAPLEAGHVRMYTCGPTVYNVAHIGNLRTFVFEDVLRRHFRAAGLRVTQIMNLTDVDDKTIRGAAQENLPLSEFTARYIEAFFRDLKRL